jgi:NADPH:quinone reductase-like Zn-dependent oxidoreductase
MKAIVRRAYGLPPDVLELVDVDKPVPADDEVLVRVRASSVNPTEWYGVTGLLVGRMRGGLLRPKEPRLGADFAGVVEAVGASVTDFEPGDEVFGARTGAFAAYVSVRNAIAPKPANATFEQAAAVPIAALTALQGLRDQGQLQPGQKVLVNGASGGVGTFAVQIAKALGAEVTAVCSTRNVEQAWSLGADRVVDYTRDDFTRSGERYDLFFDVAGSRSWSECRRVLRPESIFVIVGAQRGRSRLLGPLAHIPKIRLRTLRASQKVVFFIAKLTREDLQVMRELIEAGKVTPVVERTYPLAETAEALRYLGEGHARGKIVVTV